MYMASVILVLIFVYLQLPGQAWSLDVKIGIFAQIRCSIFTSLDYKITSEKYEKYCLSRFQKYFELSTSDLSKCISIKLVFSFNNFVFLLQNHEKSLINFVIQVQSSARPTIIHLMTTYLLPRLLTSSMPRKNVMENLGLHLSKMLSSLMMKTNWRI